MNRRFQEYKKSQIILVDELDIGFEVKIAEIVFSEERKPKEKFNRAKTKREFEKKVKEEMEDYER